MFETLVPGAGYGYGAQQFGPQGYLGSPYSQFGQPGGFQTAGLFGQQQPGPFGPQQIGGQPGGVPSGMTQQPFGAGTGIPGILPLTVAPGAVPFQQIQQTQPQLGPWHPGAAQSLVGQQQLGGLQPHFAVIPVLTPQGIVGQLVLMILPQPGGGAPWATAGYGYGVPQISPQALMGGVQPGFGGGGFGGQYGGVAGLGGGYSPFQAQQLIPQQQIPQTYVPFVPIGATGFPGQPPGVGPIH